MDGSSSPLHPPAGEATPDRHPADPIIAIEHLSKSFDGGSALSDVSLTFGAGAVHGLELVEDAVSDAIENARRNEITNASFYAGDVRLALGELAQRAGRPDVLVLDLTMPGGSSIEAIGRLREEAPETQIVVITMDDSPVFAQRAIAAGALGYVSKELADIELPGAVRAAAAGEQFVSPRLAARLDALNRSLAENRLTPREVEVLRLIAFGHTSVEIARKLHLSPRTVETHRAHVHRKLGLSTRAELVRYALRRGLLGS